MRLPRLTTRRLMVLVALVAVAIVGSIEIDRKRLGVPFKRQADEHARLERMFVNMGRDREERANDAEQQNERWLEDQIFQEQVAKNHGRPDWLDNRSPREIAEGCRQSASRCFAIARYHATLKQKYERATRYPWLSVRPDPPMPR